MASLPRADVAEAVLHLLLADTNACSVPTASFARWLCRKCRRLHSALEGTSAGRRSDLAELPSMLTHAAPLFMHNLPMPQARPVLVNAIWENLRLFPQ